MDLVTGRSIARQYVTQVPITPQVVNIVSNLAETDKNATRSEGRNKDRRYFI